MTDNFYQKKEDLLKNQEEIKKEDKKKPEPHHDLPPHLLKELFDLKEKVGRLEGQMDVLLRFKKSNIS